VAPSAIDPQGERVRRFLLEREAVAMKRPASSRLGRPLAWLFPPAEGTYVFEYAGCDTGRCHPVGEVRGSWLINSDDVHPVEATPRTASRAQRGMYYLFRRVHFHILPGGEHVVLATIAGPRAGCGGLYRVVVEGVTRRCRRPVEIPSPAPSVFRDRWVQTLRLLMEVLADGSV
jgi:hypothetical protein